MRFQIAFTERNSDGKVDFNEFCYLIELLNKVGGASWYYSYAYVSGPPNVFAESEMILSGGTSAQLGRYIEED